MKNIKDHWEKHFNSYDLFQMNFSSYLTMLEFHKENMKGLKVVLDSGAGSGNLTLELLMSKHKVIAMDNNSKALNILKHKCSKYKDNLTIQDQDLNKKIKLRDKSVDGVVSSIVVPFTGTNINYFDEINRVLKEGGRLSLSAWLPRRGFASSKYLMPKLEAELKSKKLLPKFKKEWNEIWSTTKTNENIIMENGLTKREIRNLLKRAGFIKITEKERNPYGSYALFLTAVKA